MPIYLSIYLQSTTTNSNYTEDTVKRETHGDGRSRYPAFHFLGLWIIWKLRYPSNLTFEFMTVDVFFFLIVVCLLSES